MRTIKLEVSTIKYNIYVYEGVYLYINKQNLRKTWLSGYDPYNNLVVGELYDRLTGLGNKPIRNTVNVRVSCLGIIPMESRLRV